MLAKFRVAIVPSFIILPALTDICPEISLPLISISPV
jgi:hypothetical protein